MNTEKDNPQTKIVVPMTEATKQRLAVVAKLLRGKELFPEKVARAKQAFQNLTTLPL